MKTARILIVEDDLDLQAGLESLLMDQGHSVVSCSNAEDALNEIKFRDIVFPFDVLLLDVKLPGSSGLKFLREVKSDYPALITVIMTAHGNRADSIEAENLGAFSYLEKPIDQIQLEHAIRMSLLARQQLKALDISDPQLLLNSSATRDIASNWRFRLAQIPDPILILGPAGTGKETTARALHSISPSLKGPVIVCDSKSVTEKTLFGELGSNHGLLQQAEGGSLLIYRPAFLSVSLQKSLAEFIRSGRYLVQSIDGQYSRCVPSQVKLYFSSELSFANLKEKVSDEGFFDLISKWTLTLLPIRERLNHDQKTLFRLAEYFIDRYNEKSGAAIRGVRESAMTYLCERSWAGNLRELEAVLERALILETSDHLSLNALTLLKPDQPGRIPLAQDRPIDFHTEKEQFERDFIVKALSRFSGKINQTVIRAGIPKNTLLRKIKKYGIQPKEFGQNDFQGESLN